MKILAKFLQSRNPNSSLNQQQAHQGQLIQFSGSGDPIGVGVSRQVIAEQLIRIMRKVEAAACHTLLQMRIMDAQAAAADALLLQSRNHDHDQQQAHCEMRLR
eukprot:scaffold90993_cov72-Cyclotella_meneghiniana.AAC.3